MPQGRYAKFHVLAGGTKMSIYIDGPIEVRAIQGTSAGDARKTLEVVAEHADELLSLWRLYNGENRPPDR
ncbi:MAG: hypothetical protein ACLPSH_12895 [Vulcanimicrobiaceae bacterium]